MDKTIQPLLEEQLPSQFIYDLGLYLQTCAHIETAVCSLVARLEAARDGREIDGARFHELRKLPIKELISRFYSTLPIFSERPADELEPLVDWIKTYQRNRHIAAHGAFFQDRETRDLRVLYTHKKKDHGKTMYFAEETILTRETVLQLIKDADRILRTVVSLDISVEKGEIPFRSPSSTRK